MCLVVVYLQCFAGCDAVSDNAVPQAEVAGTDMETLGYLSQSITPAYFVNGGFAFACYGTGLRIGYSDTEKGGHGTNSVENRESFNISTISPRYTPEYLFFQNYDREACTFSVTIR